jgi:hypothetical protein
MPVRCESHHEFEAPKSILMIQGHVAQIIHQFDNPHVKPFEEHLQGAIPWPGALVHVPGMKLLIEHRSPVLTQNVTRD